MLSKNQKREIKTSLLMVANFIGMIASITIFVGIVVVIGSVFIGGSE